jgi:hypothetical protein
MIDNQIVRQVMLFGQGIRTLTRAEKHLIVTLVETLVAEVGLGEAMFKAISPPSDHIERLEAQFNVNSR